VTLAPQGNDIGLARCPLCTSDRARLRVSAKKLAYLVCNGCHCQLFARGTHADTALRALMVGPVTERASTKPPTRAPAATATPQAPAPPPPNGMSWGIFRS
jgi:hypothetical protein